MALVDERGRSGLSESGLDTLAPEPGDGATLAGEGEPQLVAASSEPSIAQIGRHVVIRKLGAGAMGVVFAAYDPELDRKLALKLIRQRSQEPRAQGRMLREAQAMARVSHPNVISIYDVGTHDGQVYIAMEFVAGTSLRAWLDEHPIPSRDLQRTLDLFIQAGRGLAAAHEVNLVHRDFKPDNVLVGDDGRVRVLDFGLARAVEHGLGEQDMSSAREGELEATFEGEELGESTQASLSKASLLDRELTHAGSLVGTPAYMPPEHLGGARSDARGDQFSFCVALWEAVYGGRPFVGETVPHMFGALISGRITSPPSDRRAQVPDWLHAALLRGLSTDPAARWPDMPALLDALAPPPATTRRWIVASVAVVASVLALLAWSATREREPSLCTGFSEQLELVWDDARREALRDAFAASGRDYAQASADAVVESLDAWTDEWLAMRTNACVATHLRGDQSPELLDLRMACLDRRLAQFDALVGVLEAGDEEVVERAATAASSLEGLSACADVERLRARTGPPEDPVLAAKVSELEAELDRVEALYAAGRYREGLAGVDELGEAVEVLDWAPLLARHSLVRGNLLEVADRPEEARAALLGAIATAYADDDHALAATALVALLWSMRRAHEHYEALDMFNTLAASEVARIGDPGLEARMHRALGKARWEQGRYDEAIAEFEAALSLREASLGASHLLVAESRNDLAHTYHAKGETERAREVFLDSRARYVAELGPNHPMVADIDNELGGLAWRGGDYEAAASYYRSALDIRTRAFGERHSSLSGLIANIGATHAMKGEFEQAVREFERAVDIVRGLDDPTLLASNLDNLAGAEAMLAHFERARELYREAYEVRRKIYDDDHPDLARSLINMGQLEIEAGNPQQAKVMLEQALVLREGVEVQRTYRARARWKLAEALWQLGETRRVRELLEGAAEDYKAAGMAGSELERFEAKVEMMLGEKL